MSKSISNYLINVYGRDISLDDLRFIDTFRRGAINSELIFDFFSDQIKYSDVKIKSHDLVNIFYFINLRLIELLFENTDETKFQKLFDLEFKQAFNADVQTELISKDYSKLKYVIDVLLSNVCAIDFYYGFKSYAEIIHTSHGYYVDYSKLILSDMDIILNKFGNIMLPTRTTITHIINAEETFGVGWYYNSFGLDANTLRELLKYIE